MRCREFFYLQWSCTIRLVCLIGVFVSVYALPVNAQSRDKELNAEYPDKQYVNLLKQASQSSLRGDRLAQADQQQRIGLLLYHEGNYAAGIRYLLLAQSLLRQAKQTDRLAANLNELGTVYYYNRQAGLARRQFNEALTIYRRTGSRQGLAQTYGNIGHLYEKEGDLPTALHYQRLALTQYRGINQPAGLAAIYENLGSIYEDQNRYDSARAYYRAALAVVPKADWNSQIGLINNLGDIHRKTGHYQQALAYYRQCARQSRHVADKYQLNGAYRDLGKTFQLLQQHDSAYHYFEASHDLTDTIYAAETNRQIALMQTLYDVERKNNQITELNARQQLNTLITGGTVAGLLLVGGLAVVIISRQRLKIRAEAARSQQAAQIYQTQRELMQAELTNKQLSEENLRYQLQLNGQQLTSHTLHLIQKNQVLDELRADLTTLLNDDKRDQRRQLKQVVQKIGQSFSHDKNWDDFRATFDQVHPQFLADLTSQYPTLTSAERRLAALLRMNMTSGDTATLLGISADSLRVSRYRLRKKLGLAEGESLTAFMQRL
ncbi:TPR repeat protein [Spirosoma oryzae]|uniref:TPR repeat protein n=1 Tax=Spirosoma oryzae TaxID=1469603 RepID=A0A2T0SUD7_9BACT|nr:tetratricopeptide repeat protein [Spirosoma oryzae]PRY36973.1 TPR repeat protein [Spirosoma oryzae]